MLGVVAFSVDVQGGVVGFAIGMKGVVAEVESNI